MKRTIPLLLLLAPIALTGCHAIKAHNPFRQKEPAYASAQQKQPLQVPPGMDQPPTNEALIIPNAGTAGTAAASLPAGTPAAAIQPESSAPPAAETSPVTATTANANSLVLSDTPDNAYKRVGRALASGKVGRVTARDAEHSYQVAVESGVTAKPRDDSLQLGKTGADSATVTVSVTPRGNGSAVEVSGGPDAVARVLAVLRERLK